MTDHYHVLSGLHGLYLPDSGFEYGLDTIEDARVEAQNVAESYSEAFPDENIAIDDSDPDYIIIHTGRPIPSAVYISDPCDCDFGG